ncbi:MAG: hypothetical protein PF444_09735, partial [Bacteroidales bacterium]|nr:hypothetical protein [Bacteroidales bacterium]
MTVKGYLQSHMLDYYLGDGMTTPPTPPIQTAKCIWKGSASTNIWNTTNSNWRVEGDTGSNTQGDDVMFDISGQARTSVVLDEILTPSSVKVITALNYSFDGSGTISGTSGLLKAGSGELTFNSPMRYSGSTRVEEGALYVNDTLTHSPVIVYMGALLGGNGGISQSVELIKGAYLSPGEKDATGTFSFGKDLTISTDCIALYDITNDTTGIQKPSDNITVNGNLSISSATTLVINKKDGEVLPGTYPLITYTGTFTGNINKIDVSGLFGQKYVLTNTEGTLYLNVIGARETATITWSGTTGLWDLQNTIAWSLNNSQVNFVANDSV